MATDLAPCLWQHEADNSSVYEQARIDHSLLELHASCCTDICLRHTSVWLPCASFFVFACEASLLNSLTHGLKELKEMNEIKGMNDMNERNEKNEMNDRHEWHE